jgi:hypothetical protein
VIECPYDNTASAKTLAAMKDGAQIIYQARLQIERWDGFADFLAKLDGSSKLGARHGSGGLSFASPSIYDSHSLSFRPAR